jgi:hypothetical protein
VGVEVREVRGNFAGTRFIPSHHRAGGVHPFFGYFEGGENGGVDPVRRGGGAAPSRTFLLSLLMAQSALEWNGSVILWELILKLYSLISHNKPLPYLLAKDELL